jgi:glycerol-3-phosphate dehydrogenase
MSHPDDGRISFVIPRPDFGPGVVVVGTTDGTTDRDPERAQVEASDIAYLLGLLNANFPDLGLSEKDILSAYVGVRPLVNPARHGADAGSLQKVSREHEIETVEGGVTIVAGGKYTTHRTMAAEIVEHVLAHWNHDARSYVWPAPPMQLRDPKTRVAPNWAGTPEAIRLARAQAAKQAQEIPEAIWARYGAAALTIADIQGEGSLGDLSDPEGFPWLEAQLRYAIRHEMVLRLEDFWLRRLPLYAARKDQAEPWMETLSRVWAKELMKSEDERLAELASLRSELESRSSWRKTLSAKKNAGLGSGSGSGLGSGGDHDHDNTKNASASSSEVYR